MPAPVDPSVDPRLAAELAAAFSPPPVQSEPPTETEGSTAIEAAAKTELSGSAQRRAQLADRLAAISASFEKVTHVQLAGQEAIRGNEPKGDVAKKAAEDEETKDGEAIEAANKDELTPEQAQEIRELKSRDREVKTHEQAHIAAAGDLARGGASYTYQVGPDGKRYAVGGEVDISLSEGRTPKETISRARRAQRAALAPAEPSPKDRQVAAKAAAMEQRGQRELAEEADARAQEKRSEERGEERGEERSEEHSATSETEANSQYEAQRPGKQ
ncbi:MAG: hypothetical protein CSA65_07625 [Proteobacteria bacterium]|nr:MAG: hypothetical protein CSB49_06735 [Pseudomonadota bacterium]PIE17762.1 MAG: hypothetical protein CSA65_07625 [Pseudomonadota bacterium]